jgi:hypothetical protein
MYNTPLPASHELPTKQQLNRSTLIAALAALAILVTVVLPAEYGIDPTRIGRLLGLTAMGEIKMQLAREAEAVPAPAASEGSLEQRIADLEAALAELRVEGSPTVDPTAAPAEELPGAQSHELSFTLAPNEAAEIKLRMRQGARAEYAWSTAAGGKVNYDTHGEPSDPAAGSSHTYGQGRQVERDAGTLEAMFDGSHGWFWRNRSGERVTITLTTSGEYAEIKRVL